MLIIPLNLDSVLLLLHNSKLAYYEVSIYIAHICINFHDVIFAENFRECAIVNAVHEEIFKLHIFIESR